MLGKKEDYTIDDLATNDEWTVEDNEANSSLDASYEDVLVEVGEVEPMDDLEVPPIVDDEGHCRDNINENEDLVEEDDDYPAINMKDFLG